MLQNGVIQHNFYKYGVILHACVLERRKDVIQAAQVVFPKVFLWGGKSGEIWFLPVMCPSHFCRVKVLSPPSQSRVMVI